MCAGLNSQICVAQVQALTSQTIWQASEVKVIYAVTISIQYFGVIHRSCWRDITVLLACGNHFSARRGRQEGVVLKPAGTDNVTGAHVIIGNTSKPSVSHTRTRKLPNKSLPFVLKSTPECRSRLFYLAIADDSFSCFALLRRHLSLSLSLTRYPHCDDGRAPSREK